METLKELQAKLEQAEKEWTAKSCDVIKVFERIIMLKAELNVVTDEKKPELRHGDVRWKNPGDPIIFLGEDWYNYRTKLTGNGREDTDWLAYPYRFNFFDDLKRNIENFNGYCKRVSGGGDFRISLLTAGDGKIQFKVADERATTRLDEAVEIHQQLGVAIANLKRKQAKGGAE